MECHWFLPTLSFPFLPFFGQRLVLELLTSASLQLIEWFEIERALNWYNSGPKKKCFSLLHLGEFECCSAPRNFKMISFRREFWILKQTWPTNLIIIYTLCCKTGVYPLHVNNFYGPLVLDQTFIC